MWRYYSGKTRKVSLKGAYFARHPPACTSLGWYRDCPITPSPGPNISLQLSTGFTRHERTGCSAGTRVQGTGRGRTPGRISRARRAMDGRGRTSELAYTAECDQQATQSFRARALHCDGLPERLSITRTLGNAAWSRPTTRNIKGCRRSPRHLCEA